MFRILICEDDLVTALAIEACVKSEIVETYIAHNGNEAINLIEDIRFHLVITDMMMPEVDGMGVAKYIKNHSLNIPTICISALNDEDTIIDMYKLNIIEYITKPINYNILELKLNKTLQLLNLNNKEIIFDQNKSSVTVNNEVYVLSNKEYELMYELYSFPNQYFSKYDLLNGLWYGNMNMSEKVVEVTISRLRKKLGSNSDLIKTVKNKGYTYAPKD